MHAQGARGRPYCTSTVLGVMPGMSLSLLSCPSEKNKETASISKRLWYLVFFPFDLAIFWNNLSSEKPFQSKTGGFLSPENAETRCFDAARSFCLFVSFQNNIPVKCSQFCEGLWFWWAYVWWLKYFPGYLHLGELGRKADQMSHSALQNWHQSHKQPEEVREHGVGACWARERTC